MLLDLLLGFLLAVLTPLLWILAFGAGTVLVLAVYRAFGSDPFGRF